MCKIRKLADGVYANHNEPEPGKQFVTIAVAVETIVLLEVALARVGELIALEVAKDFGARRNEPKVVCWCVGGKYSEERGRW